MSIEDVMKRVDPKYQPFAFSWPTDWEDIVIKLDKDLAEIDPEYKILQVKQKFGSLRFYYLPSDGLTEDQKDAMRDLVWWAEVKSNAILRGDR